MNQVIVGENREAGAQKNKGLGSQIRELGKKSWETGVLKWQEAGEITWQYLIFVGSKKE